MMLVGFLLQKLENVDVQVMIPDDWRGESLYYWHNLVDGLTPHPMDLENKGMDTARRFLNLVKLIKASKRDNFIAPDGPAGPAFEVKPGALFIAQKAKTPLVPIAAYARHSYIVPRWDGYVIPYPFSRIQVVIQPPFEVPPKADLKALNDQLRHTLNETWVAAQTRYYVPA